MKKYKINYKTNKGEMKGKTLTIIQLAENLEEAKERFHRCSGIIAGDDVSYKADIITISEASESQMKRYIAQGVPGA